MDVKKPTTFEEQLDLLEKRGFIISDEAACLSLLHRVNYYNLSAYLLPFKTPGGTYVRNIDFQKIVDIYEFDRKIRNLLFSIIEEVELYLRTQISYYHAHKYGSLGYLEPLNYNGRHQHDSFLELLKNECIHKNSRSLVVMHHTEKYGGKFPIWVMVEFFSMGMLSRFYSDLVPQDRKQLARTLFGVEYQYLDSWLKCLTVLRNRCAHYSRLYYLKFTDYPRFSSDISNVPQPRLFGQVLMLKQLYTDKNNWNVKMMSSLKALIEQFEDSIDLSHIGFPPDWEKRLENDIKVIKGNII